jgi:hypothetical protein
MLQAAGNNSIKIYLIILAHPTPVLSMILSLLLLLPSLALSVNEERNANNLPRAS